MWDRAWKRRSRRARGTGTRTATDPETRSVCARLLPSEWVTELRSASGPASDLPRRTAEHVFIRAQLAALLRAIGQKDEAEQEARSVLAGLSKMHEPPISEPQVRHFVRARARAAEALGDDAATARAYETFVRFGSQVKRCGGCHAVEGPRSMAWFRDRWAGRKLGEYAVRSGRDEEMLRRAESRLQSEPGDPAALMIAAYLRTARGDSAGAEEAWKRLLR